MIKKGFKTLCLSLSLACLLTSFYGCGKASDSSEASVSSTVSSQAEEKEQTIKFASWAQRGDNEDVDWIYAFQRKYPKTKVEYIAITEGNYSEKLNAMIAANTAPDVILAWECDINRFATNKAIIPLDDYIKNTTAFKMDDFVPAVDELSKLNGGAVYGLPWCLATEILYYNKDMFDKGGVPYPTNDFTWQQFEDAAKALTVVENGKTVQWGADAISFGGIFYSTMGSAGDSIIDATGKLTLGDGAKKALQWQVDLTNKYKVSPAPAASGSNAIDLFSAGKAAMTRTGNWMIQTYRPITDFKWDIATLPKGEMQYSTLHTGILTINANSEVKDAAWKFIEFSMGDEGQELINKMGTNPSARKSVTAKGFYRAGGENGPTNWDALDKSLEFAKFGYVVANSGITGNAVNNFNAALMGTIDVDTAITKINEEANKAATN